MSRKYLSALIAVLALAALGMSASSALAAEEFLYEESGKMKEVPVGTNFVMENQGKAVLETTGGPTVKCNEVDVGGTLTQNNKASKLIPKAEVQSVVFGGCIEGAGTRVVVRTKTSPVWKLECPGTVAKKCVLTGISAELEIGATKCTIANKAGTEFKLTWTNDMAGSMLAELEALAQELTVAGTGCPTVGKETVNLKFEAEGIGDNTGKFFLE